MTGGVRSGKSKLATDLAKKSGKKVAFIATCAPLDREMEHRIGLHKSSRPKNWKTIEEPKYLRSALKKIPSGTGSVIVDCLTLYVSNLILSGKTEEEILNNIENTIKILKKSRFTSILVSNEVGMGIVPDNELARIFRDVSGKVNQLAAAASDEAYFMVSGLPVKIKE
ncbi:MAG: bifunctional adenosylcobinamide kinase/adenosylcobinamide-phosphate guanylyltransferase [Elusimicrobiota bacterium]